MSSNNKIDDIEVKVSDELEKKIIELAKDKPENKVLEGSGKKLPLADYDGMDTNNKKAADIMASQGINAAIEHMYSNQENSGTISYEEMRYRYG